MKKIQKEKCWAWQRHRENERGSALLAERWPVNRTLNALYPFMKWAYFDIGTTTKRMWTDLTVLTLFVFILSNESLGEVTSLLFKYKWIINISNIFSGKLVFWPICLQAGGPDICILQNYSRRVGSVIVVFFFNLYILTVVGCVTYYKILLFFPSP